MTCANCGGPVSNRGPRPRSGRRYCMNEECQRAKWVAASADRAVPARFRADAPTKCTGCGAELKARKVRNGDSPYGRWCSRVSCQNKRREIEQHPDMVEFNNVRTGFDFLHSMLTQPRTACSECGCPRTVAGFRHPAGDLTWCEGVGHRPLPPSLRLGSIAWPELVPVIRWKGEHPDVELDRAHGGRWGASTIANRFAMMEPIPDSSFGAEDGDVIPVGDRIYGQWQHDQMVARMKVPEPPEDGWPDDAGF